MRYSGNGGKCHGREISDRMDLEEQVGETCKTLEFMAWRYIHVGVLYYCDYFFFIFFRIQIVYVASDANHIF